MLVTFNQSLFEQTLQSLQPQDLGEPVPQLQVFPALASTNRTAWELVQQGALAGTTVIALQQDSGRGQWGRTWQSPPGGLYFSTVLSPALAVDSSYLLTFCSAWGITKTLQQWNVPVQIKWPNDLVLAGKKLGGILTETRILQGAIRKAVVGVGLNWHNPVPETGINLESYPTIAQLEQLAAIVFQGIWSGYQTWQAQGDTWLLQAYLELLSHRERPVRVGDRMGTIVGVSPRGSLQIRWQNPLPSELVATELEPGTISLGYDA